MSLSKPLVKVLAPLFAMIVALAAFTAVSVSTTGSADAAPTVKIKPGGPYKKNQTVKIVAKGYPAGAQIGVGVCPHKARGGGPGDCGAPSMGYSVLTVANAKGVVRTTIRIPKGKLFAVSRPKAKCSNKKKQKCSVHVSNLGGGSVYGKSKVIRYV